jgi:hypothetical protein
VQKNIQDSCVDSPDGTIFDLFEQTGAQ